MPLHRPRQIRRGRFDHRDNDKLNCCRIVALKIEEAEEDVNQDFFGGI